MGCAPRPHPQPRSPSLDSSTSSRASSCSTRRGGSWEPLTGFLGTTTSDTLAHLSKIEGLNIRLKSPSFVKSSFALDIAITTAGNFQTGYLYQDGSRE